MRRSRIVNWENLPEVARLSGVSEQTLIAAYARALKSGTGYLMVKYDDENETEPFIETSEDDE